MSHKALVLVLPGAILGLAWAVYSLGLCGSVSRAVLLQRVLSGESPPAAESPADHMLAGRYHLRTRTTRFFRRSTRSGPYDQDIRYYRRWLVVPVVPAEQIQESPQPPSGEKAGLAGRYHLRTRTTRFFGRARA